MLEDFTEILEGVVGLYAGALSVLCLYPIAGYEHGVEEPG